MTNEEAIDVLNNTAWLGTDVGIKVYPAVKMAVEALEKREKYRWHDLRKNPKDLPKEGERILFCTVCYDNEDEERIWTGNFRNGYCDDGCYFENDDYECFVTIAVYPSSEVLAWRYIEPFEEVEE